MIDGVLSLATEYGLPFLALITFLSCLALPVPVSIAMILSGSLVASGDLSLWQVFLAAYVAAMAGDQMGYATGRGAGIAILKWISRDKRRANMLEKAKLQLDSHGGLAVFFSRWLFSPLGPYVNFIGGAASMNWLVFTIAGAAGEFVWVGLYVGLGFFFSSNISAVADLAENASGFLAAGAVAGLLGWRLVVALRSEAKRR
ncbi:DedA family protein [Rhizobium sp. L1K21]|uniref:DedA family protein n=1 Tax=Rhizobium sp. L1K21 TaxID=2954933 RepID=UPI002093B18D|nr:DedA family protein [Rhizobium sp. L1K21]MCO6185489.1 DedA family protein [Rhizobium sp. L1K21]